MHIEYYGEFLVLAEELNFHAAAERLHVSQSALSKHIAELEKHHRIQLFDRGRTSVKLTAKGAVFLEQAADLYSRYEELTNLFAQMEDEEKPLTVAGILDNPLDFPLVSRTFEYCKEKGVGRLPIFIPCESTVVEDNIEMVRSGEADCVVLYATDELLEHIPDSDQLTLEEIYRVPLDAIVRRDNPLAARQSITLDDLEGRTIIRLVGPRFTSGWSQLEKQLAKAGVSVSTKLVPAASAYEYITGDPDTAILLAQRTPSFGVPMQNAEAVRVPLEDDRLLLTLGVFSPAKGASPMIAPFVESLRQSFKDGFGG